MTSSLELRDIFLFVYPFVPNFTLELLGGILDFFSQNHGVV